MSKNVSETPVIQVDNIRCKVTNLPPTLAGALSQELSVKVPNYWFSTKFKNGQWDGSQKFFLRPANTFPTGLLPKVVEFIREELGEYPKIVDKRANKDVYKLKEISEDYQISDTKDARDYQVNTINKVITNTVCGIPFMRGVINIATNGGKTAIATGFIKELYPQLVATDKVFCFVTHSKEIARQTKNNIENDLGINVGFIGDGKWVVKPVTVVIITTLYSRRKKPEFKDLIPNIMGFAADECHHSTATSWYDVFNLMTNAIIRLGLTGTVDKQNPVNEMRLYSCTGTIINRITNDYLIENGFSAKPICIMFQVSEPELEDEAYSEAYQLGIVESEERLEVIGRICKKETKSGNIVLILVEHIDHGEYIQEELQKLKKRVFFTNGTLTSDVRQTLLDDLKNHKIDVLISTSILDEGVDVSGINAVIYARGMKSSRKLLQGIGRGLRKKEDGSKLRFYDFIDDMHTSLLKHSQNRYQVLKAEKFTIKLLDIDEYEKMSWEDIESEK